MAAEHAFHALPDACAGLVRVEREGGGAQRVGPHGAPAVFHFGSCAGGDRLCGAVVRLGAAGCLAHHLVCIALPRSRAEHRGHSSPHAGGAAPGALSRMALIVDLRTGSGSDDRELRAALRGLPREHEGEQCEE